MKVHTHKHLVLPMLALSLTLAMATQARAQGDQDRGSTTLQVNFGSRPHWNGVRGTHVREVRSGERPDYDVFSYGGNYYAYSNNRWYKSRRQSGQYAAIDDQSVPKEFTRVPREHWRNYPTGWTDNNSSTTTPRHRHQH